MPAWRIIGFGLLAAGLLSGCADSSPPAPVSSHAEVTAPKSQKASIFDSARAAQNLANARMLRQAGDAAQARGYAEAAVNDWPASVDAWAELQAVCQAQADKLCQQHADFFLDKVSSLADLPPRVAVLGMQNLLEDNAAADQQTAARKSKAGGASSNNERRMDDWTIAMAQRMMAFYDRQDKVAALRDAPVERLVVDSYPPGVIAGTLAGAAAIGYGISQVK